MRPTPAASKATSYLMAFGALLTLLLFTIQAGHASSGQIKPLQQPSTESDTLTDAMKAFVSNREAIPATRQLEAQSNVPCVNGTAGSYSCNNVDLAAFVPLANIGGTGATNDIWGWTDPATGIEYALVGLTNGTAFVELSDPENPLYLGILPTHTFNSNWRDLKVYADHVFIGSEASGHGIQIFDLTQLRSVNNPPVTFSNTAHYDGVGSSHNIVINEDSGFAYAVGSGAGTQSRCSGGLHMVNITNPAAPTFAGCFSSDGYTHDAQCVIYDGPDTAYVGREICLNSNEDTVTIVDVTNKAAPVQLSRTPYTGSRYTHQGWLTDDHSYFLVDDELDELNLGHNTRTRIFDVRDLDAPTLSSSYDSPVPSIDHNLYIKGDHAFQSNYTSGVRILDVSGVASGNLSEAAFFDTYPSSDSASFNGTWSNYPYFDRGYVIATGIDEGLFVLKPNLTGAVTLSQLLSPAPNSTLTSSSAAFTISDVGSSYSLWIGSSVGANDYLSQNLGTSTSVNVSGLPTDGSTIYVRVRTLVNGSYQFNDYTLTAFTQQNQTLSQLLSPVPNSTLTGESATFTISNVGAQQYYLYVGSTVGGNQYFSQGLGTNTTANVTGLPTDGSTLYVRVWTLLAAGWNYNDYTLTASSQQSGGTSELITPAPGSTLTGSSATFTITDENAELYFLYVGSSVAGNDYFSQSLGTNTSVNVTGLPTDGSTIYVRVWTRQNGIWTFNDYTLTAYEEQISGVSELITPAPSSTLTGDSATFTISDVGADQYFLYVGSSVAGNQYFSQSLGTNTTINVTGLPTDGSTLYVRVWTYNSGIGWQFNDYVLTAFTQQVQGNAELLQPAPNSTLTASSAVFTISNEGADQYYLFVGSSVGSATYASLNFGTNTTLNVSGLPTDGSTLYVRVWTRYDGSNWEYNDYVLTAYTQQSQTLAQLLSPTPNSTLSSSSATFVISDVGASNYYLFVGSGVGNASYFSGLVTNGSVQVSGLPTDGSTVYVRVWTYLNTGWDFIDYTVTASSVLTLEEAETK